MGKDIVLVCSTAGEVSYYRIIAPSHDPGMRAVVRQKIDWPEDLLFLNV